MKHVRTIQGPYTDEAHGRVCSTGFPAAHIDYGLDAKVGGLDDLPNPGHILCAALAACLESTTRMVCAHRGLAIERLVVDVVGDVDVRGCMAMTSAVRPGFRGITATLDLGLAGAPAGVAGFVIEQVVRLCVTLDTLRNGVPVRVERSGDAPHAGAV
ncbi:MAG TPA: OsmC family protein [Myxococcales bacterium]|nr:OsmC family protein [Myxococcales bacterium]